MIFYNHKNILKTLKIKSWTIKLLTTKLRVFVWPFLVSGCCGEKPLLPSSGCHCCTWAEENKCKWDANSCAKCLLHTHASWSLLYTPVLRWENIWGRKLLENCWENWNMSSDLSPYKSLSWSQDTGMFVWRGQVGQYWGCCSLLFIIRSEGG